MRVACVGDIMLDVIVSTERPLAIDDDTEATISFAPGGQAANVAAWVVALGGSAVVVGPRGPGAGALAVAALEDRGITVTGPVVPRSGAVVSLVAGGQRSMASDGGSPAWLDQVAPGQWLEDLDWLFVSGYALLRARHPQRLTELSRDRKVAVDLSSAAMIREYGVEGFRALWQSLRPAVVFANDEEWAACGGAFGGSLVLKHGPEGASFDGAHHAALATDVVDVTGAGDALAAGWLVGGAELAMRAAARCVAQVGAQPPAA